MADHDTIRPRLELLADLLTKKLPEGTVLNVALMDIVAARKGVDALMAERQQMIEALQMLLEHHDAGCVSPVPCAAAEYTRELLKGGTSGNESDS